MMALETSFISSMVSEMVLIASTALRVRFCTSLICWEISSVALPVWVARCLTSLATTAKPLPASPALAASMVAFKAKRLVWLAMSLIKLTTSPILAAASTRPRTNSSVFWASSAALAAIWLACPTCEAISRLEADNSSEAAETVSTLAAACSTATVTDDTFSTEVSVVSVICWADWSSCEAALTTEPMIRPILSSKSLAILIRSAKRRSEARLLAS